MNDVSIVNAVTSSDADLGRRAGTARKAAETKPAPIAAQPAEMASKTKVKTEMPTPHSFTYTFFDPRTDEVVGRWPITPTYDASEERVAPGVILSTEA